MPNRFAQLEQAEQLEQKSLNLKAPRDNRFAELEKQLQPIPQIEPGLLMPQWKADIEAEEKKIRSTLDRADKLAMPLSDTEAYSDALDAIEKKKPIGFVEGLTEDALFKIPVTGPLLEGLDLARIKLASIRLNTPDFDWEKEANYRKSATLWEYDKPRFAPLPAETTKKALKSITAESVRQQDIDAVMGYISVMAEREERGYNFWGKVGQGLSVLPAWMFEFALTGGLYRSGSAPVKKLLQKHARSKLLAKTGGWIAGSAVRTTVGMPQRTFANSMRRSLHEDEGWATSIAKGWGETFIEAASEEAGKTITGGVSWVTSGAINKLPFGKKFLSALQKSWVKLSPENTAKKFAERIATKAGYHGLLGEYGEERLATLLHGIAGTETFGLPEGADTFDRVLAGIKQDFEVTNALAEVVVLSTPGAIKVSIGQIGRVANDSMLRKAIETEVGVSKEAAKKAVQIKNDKGVEKADQYLSAVKTMGEEAAEKVIAEEKPPEAPEPEVAKRHAVEILPRKQEILGQIDEAIKEAPSEEALVEKLQKEIPQPELPADPTDEQYQDWQKAVAERTRRITEEVNKIKSQKVDFEIDGGAKIINTKEALRTFRDSVKKLRERETIPKARPKVTKKKPIAAKREKIQELVKAPEGWFTDGRILVRGKSPARAKKAEGWEERKPVKIDDVIQAPTKPATFEHYAVRDPSIGEGISDRPVPHIEEPGTTPPLAVFKSGGKYYVYEQDRFNVIRNRYPDAEYGITEHGTLIAYMGRNQPVGAVMPIRIGDEYAMDEPPVKMQPLPETVTKEPEPVEPLKDYKGKISLPDLGEISFRYQYVEYPKHGQHMYNFNWEYEKGNRIFGQVNFSAPYQEVDAAGGPVQYAKKWAQEALAKPTKEEAKPKAVREFDDYWSEVGEKPESLEDAVLEYLANENEKFQALEDKLMEIEETDPAGKTDAHKKVMAQLDKMRADLKSQIEATEIEQPSLFEPPEKLVVERSEPKHISKVVVDEFREWPEDIPKVGKDYWVDAMAVAKTLLTPMRYRALRRTMLGVFRHERRPAPKVVGIEVQDVRDALTVTHELGHNIDWLVNNKSFPSSIKARFPDTKIGEMKLRQELKNVSKILRPDLWERPKAYVKKHTELIADFISHYILDPENTRELAPNATKALEAKLAEKPELFDTISRLQDSRYTGPVEPPIAEHIRESFPLPKEFAPMKLVIDMTDKDYVKAAEGLGITAARHYKVLMERSRKDAERIDSLVPNKARQIDLVVVAENGTENPWTGKTLNEIRAEGIKPDEQKAIDLFRGYQELARQTVNKYLRGADIAEYIKFIEDYFIHTYQTPMTEKYKTAISKWAKRSPQVKKRVLPDLAKAVELGLKPRAKTLSEGLLLWAGINYRVATNKAFLRTLPQITNDDGVSILQKPQDFPAWPTVDYWPIRQTYAVPLKDRGVLLFQGRVAVDPKVKPFIDAMFGRRAFSTPVRIIEGFNAIAKAFELTLFSFFHHQAEFFSAVGSLGPRAMPFVGGYYGKRAQAFGKEPKLWGFLPARIGVLKAGKQLEKTREFMEDYLAHGGQTGYISTEGINLMERMLKSAAGYFENIVQTKPTTPLTGVFAAAYVPVKTAQAAYSFHQQLLWDNVQRAKLVTYYNIVADGAKYSDLPMKQVKETAAQYIADNYGGQEWLNTMFRKPKVRQFWTQLMMSLDWTVSQIKTSRWPFAYGGKTDQEKARRALMRKIGQHHWFWYLTGISAFTIAASYALSGKPPWENEMGHKLDIDWTKIWRSLPWNRDWKARGDYSRRYIGLGKAGRELVRWVTSPLRAFGYKLSPGARTLFEQTTGYNIGSDFPETWKRDDLEYYQEIYARFGNVMEKFVPFALSGNNAFLAFPSRKGMTHWKAIRSFEELFDIRANIASGGLTAKLTKASHILDRSNKELVVDIKEACKLNNVNWQKALRAGLSNVRSKYYGRFWNAAKQQDVDKSNRYADALVALGVTEEGFTQSLVERADRLSKESIELGVKLFVEKRKPTKEKVVPQD